MVQKSSFFQGDLVKLRRNKNAIAGVVMELNEEKTKALLLLNSVGGREVWFPTTKLTHLKFGEEGFAVNNECKWLLEEVE